MKIARLFLVIFFATTITYSQAPKQTKEIKIPYSNGHEVFKICVSGCQTNFSDSKEYFWYTDFSNIKSSTGGSGGNLLHGNYKLYDENGNLRKDKNYHLGLPNGTQKTWDSTGNIISSMKYKNGDMIYWKFRGDDGFWVEHIGAMLTVGWIKKTYNKYYNLISEQILLQDLKFHTKIYFPNGELKLKEEYTTSLLGDDHLLGKYSSYYENGKIEVDGQYNDGEYSNIRIGTWKWYKSDGMLETTEHYKANIEFWGNGKLKVVGGYILNSETKTWQKTGIWIWKDEEGKLLTNKKYEWGDEIND